MSQISYLNWGQFSAPNWSEAYCHFSRQSSQFLMSLKVSNFRAVDRPQAVVEEILDDLENEVAGPLHLRADGISKKPDDRKDKSCRSSRWVWGRKQHVPSTTKDSSGILFWQSVYVFLTLLIGPVPGQLGHFDVSRVTMKLGVSYGGLRNILTTNWLRSGTPK